MKDIEIIRPMQEKDLEEVAAVDVATFNHWWKNERGKDLTLLPRALPLLRLYLEEDPGGSLVAVSSTGEIIGYLFSHIWGKIGWIGPLGVLPFYQGRGIARKMIAQVLEHLTGAGATTITLETMPESVKNLSLYVSLGFQPHGLRLQLSKFPFEEKRPGRPVAYGAGSQDAGLEFIPIDDPSLFGDVVTLSGLALPGLDCTRAIFLNAKHAIWFIAPTGIAVRNFALPAIQLLTQASECSTMVIKNITARRSRFFCVNGLGEKILLDKRGPRLYISKKYPPVQPEYSKK